MSSSSLAALDSSSEAIMLEKRLEEELKSMLPDMIGSHQDNSHNGEESDVEAKGRVALYQAAKELCYKRKYYNASKDEVIYFPTLVKTIIDRSLIEKADDFYASINGGDEEFPREYSMRLRKIAFRKVKEDGEFGHEDDSEQQELNHNMMMHLSEPVGAAVTITASNNSGQNKIASNEQTLIWKRGTTMRGDDDVDISFPVEDDTFADDESLSASKKYSISEDQIQKNLGLRRQASFLRKASIMDSLEKYYEPEMMKKSNKLVASKESEMRQTRIIREVKKMIERMLQSRDFEDEMDMEPAAQQAFVKAAQDVCYTRKYYDASGDEMVYFPSLVKTITKNTLFEKAEEYYNVENEEEFPEEYIMGLTKAAFAQMEEENLPHDYDEGEEEEMEYRMMMQLSQPVQAPTNSPMKKKFLANSLALKDKRMDAAEETLVWTRATREMDAETSVEVAMVAEASMAAALASIPNQPPLPTTVKKKPIVDNGVKPPTMEEKVQLNLGLRRQASFLRKAAVLDAIGKNENDVNLPPIGKSSDSGIKKMANVQPSKLVDKRMEASEDSFVWTRTNQNFSANASIPFEAAALPEKKPLLTKKEAPAVTEEKVQENLGMRRQASFLRKAAVLDSIGKAAVLDSIGKHEGEENLPSIGEAYDSGKKKTRAQPSKLVDNRMYASEEALVWTRTNQNLGSAANIPFKATYAPDIQFTPTKEEAAAKNRSVQGQQAFGGLRQQSGFLRMGSVKKITEEGPKQKKTFGGLRHQADFLRRKKKESGVTEEKVKHKLGLRRQASCLRKAAVMDSMGKNEGEVSLLIPSVSGKKKTKSTPSKLVDKRMEASDEAFVWTRGDGNIASDPIIPFDATTVEEKQRFPTKIVSAVKKAGAVTEEKVQQKLGFRLQSSFLRKAVVMDSMGKNEGEVKLPPVEESSDTGMKKTKGKASKLVDKRMDTSEEAFVWTRTGQDLGANTIVPFEAEALPQQKPLPTKKEAPTVKEEDVQQKLGTRRQESFVRKAAVLNALGKNEGDVKLPPVGESPDPRKEKKTESRQSILLDNRMTTSEESFVWSRTSWGHIDTSNRSEQSPLGGSIRSPDQKYLEPMKE